MKARHRKGNLLGQEQPKHGPFFPRKLQFSGSEYKSLWYNVCLHGKCMSKEWLILTGVGVEKSFPEGSNLNLTSEDQLSTKKGGETLKAGIGNFNKDAESG